MGLDKIYFTFYRYFGGTEDLEENKFSDNYKYIPGEAILLDGNFILYQIIAEIENDLNNLLKIILSISHQSDRTNLIKLIEELFTNSPLKNYRDYFEEIFYLESLDEMIQLLRDKTLLKNDTMDKIICSYYIDYIKNKILKLHDITFVKEFYLVFDGIPSGFKIIEQRRRRLKNFLESSLRKKLLVNKFDNIEGELGEYDIMGEKYIYDYGLYVKYLITLSKSFGPSSEIFNMIGLNIKGIIESRYNNINFYFSGVNELGEGDYKIISLVKMCKYSHIVIHCSDFDFIVFGSRLQIDLNKNIYMVRHFTNNYCVANFSRLNSTILEFIKNRYKCDNDYNILHDFNFIIGLFGNDYIPLLTELNFDNNFIDILNILANKLWINKKYIVNHEKIDMNNLKIFFDGLSLISQTLSFKNNLKKKYYINEILRYLPKNINSFEEFKENILLPYWYKNIINIESWNDFYTKDLRIDIIQLYINNIREELIKRNLKRIKKKLLNNQKFLDIYEKKIDDKINEILCDKLKPYLIESFGLECKKDNLNLYDNKYDNLYYYYYYDTKNKISNKFIRLNNKTTSSEYEMFINLNEKTKKEIVLNYLLSLDFNNYKYYNPTKITYNYYKYYNSPKISWINKYILDYKEKPENHIINSDDYIDPELHLLLISPNSIPDNDYRYNFVKNNNKLIYINDDFDIDESIEVIKINNYRDLDLKDLKEKWTKYIRNNLLLQNQELILKEFNSKVL